MALKWNWWDNIAQKLLLASVTKYKNSRVCTYRTAIYMLLFKQDNSGMKLNFDVYKDANS